MRWRGRKQSGNVQDRRGMSGRGMIGGIGGGGVIILLLVALLTGTNPLELLMGTDPNPGVSTGSQMTNPKQDSMVQFVGVVLQDTEDAWNKIFREQLGEDYQEPQLVVFDNYVNSACGTASSATGPFYCPGDAQVYIDLSFFEELERRFKAPGDFAMAYVIAHEVGHHVQHLLGTTDKVDRMRGRISREEYNKLSVRLELQADYYAGVWAHHAQRMKNILEEGDIAEALGAANAIGDDRLQKQSQGYVVPESFTHGTSAQRMRWFQRGWQSGTLEDGDTFAATNL